MAERSELLPTTALGQYQIRGRIGSGGMGEVYDAVHTGLNRRVAIKTLRRRFLDDETVVQRFLREGQLASRIRHPNIVDVTDVGMLGGLPCLIMEHLEGEPLGAVVKRDGAMPITPLVDLLLPIVAAIDHAHECGVLHRDIKPSNIFLARSWNGDLTPKVLDFGISKLVHESAQAALTTDSAFVGTPHYASPELIRADRNADGRSDQYSMGVVLYECVTGKKPFLEKGGNFVALAMAICTGEYAPPRHLRPDLPPAFEAVILKAMALDVADRYPSMRALGEALLPFASERARLIWGPSFAGSGGAAAAPLVAPAPHDGTAVMMVRPSQQNAAAHMLGASSNYPSFGANGMHGSGSVPIVHPSATPPAGAYDRTPSYSIGHGSFGGTAAPRKSGMATAAMIAVGFVVAIGAVIGVLKFTGKATAASASESPPTPSAASGPSAAAPASTYTIALSVTPDHAAFELDGAAAGTGKLSRSFPRDGHKHHLRVSAPGHETVLFTFDEKVPLPPSIVLRPAAQAGGGTSSGGARPATGGGSTAGSGASGGGHAGGGAGKGQGKTPDNRPRTDNIDPWE